MSRIELFPREHTVLVGMAAGLTNYAIAHEMGVAARTAKGYRTDLYAKLGANSGPEAVAIAFSKGILSRRTETPHQPGDPHDYLIECRTCGERGMIRLTIDPQAADSDGVLDPARVREALHAFVRTYANVEHKDADSIEVGLFDAFLRATSALGIKPTTKAKP